ncbi:ABC transporter substrate-binding protein [Polymorphospora lycopeni]|uniref:ABC transporter substrate-binding protein n=1 Tax=Polymorphospora lycopeni TaxID=3140240 RepID=A0ABV5D1W4_9ACTN
MTQQRLHITPAPYLPGLSRRRLLYLGAAASGALLTGCTGSGAGGTGGPATGTPRTGGAAVVGGLAPFTTFDPQNASDAIGVTRHLFDSLYEVDETSPELAVRPVLATGPPTRTTPTTWQVTFRTTGFHDGTAMTADDVAFSVQRVAAPPDGQVSFYSQLLGFVTGVRVVAADTIEITTAHPVNADVFARRLALPALGIVPKALVEAQGAEFGTRPVGSGPYEFVSYRENQSVELRRFAGYTGPSGGWFDTISWRVLVDDTARASALRARQVDVAQSPPFRDLELLRGSGFEVVMAPTPAAVFLTFNCAKAPFTDPRVRQALHYAIDHDSITRIAYAGNAAFATSVLPDWHPDHARPTAVFDRDPDTARSLLAAAGVPAGLKVVLQAQQTGYMQQTATVIRQNWQDLGLDVDLRIEAGTTLAGKILGGGDFDAVISSGNPVGQSFDVPGALSSFYAPGAFRDKFLRWSGPAADRFAELLDTAPALPADQAPARYAQLQQLLADEVPTYPMHFLSVPNVVDTGAVAGLGAQRWEHLDLRRAWRA